MPSLLSDDLIFPTPVTEGEYSYPENILLCDLIYSYKVIILVNIIVWNLDCHVESLCIS